jgi:rhamnulokinase
MGLWLVQECATLWKASYAELTDLARAARADVPLFDPDDDALLRPGDMPARIAEACRALGQPEPADRGEIVRSILVSLACKYRLVLERLERVTGREVDVVHVIGGGSRNELLCQMTADLLGRPVLAGPVEATALGNVLVQARAVGELGTLAEMRAVAAASADPAAFEPGEDGDQIYQRFLEVTGQNVKETVP